MEKTQKIGVQFQLPQNYDTHFAVLFQNIDTRKYTWHIANSEILCHNEKTKTIDEFTMDGTYIGEAFEKRICHTSYHVIAARIFASPSHCKAEIDDILDYNSFLCSKFEIALLCADSYVDFYAKDQRIINYVFHAAKQLSSNSVSFITMENDSRTNFYI